MTPPRCDRVWLFGLLAACVLVGCGKKGAESGPSKPPEKKAEKPLERQNVTSGAGDSVTYSEDAKRQRLYTARWTDGQVSIGEKGVRSVKMTGVSGEIFRDEKERARYRADGGRTVDGTRVLALAGRVRVTAKDPKAVLECDRLEYHPGRAAVRARGNVRLDSGGSRLEGFSELWVSDDFRTFGPAELFPVKKR